MPPQFPPEILNKVLTLRNDPEFEKTASPKAKEVFKLVLGEQYAPHNVGNTGWLKDPLGKFVPAFMQGGDESFAPTETTAYGDVFRRPQAGVKNFLDTIFKQHQNPFVVPAMETGLRRPREVPTYFQENVDKPINVSTPLDENQPLAVMEHFTKGFARDVFNVGRDAVVDPINLIPGSAFNKIPGFKNLMETRIGKAAKPVVEGLQEKDFDSIPIEEVIGPRPQPKPVDQPLQLTYQPTVQEGQKVMGDNFTMTGVKPSKGKKMGVPLRGETTPPVKPQAIVEKPANFRATFVDTHVGKPGLTPEKSKPLGINELIEQKSAPQPVMKKAKKPSFMREEPKPLATPIQDIVEPPLPEPVRTVTPDQPKPKRIVQSKMLRKQVILKDTGHSGYVSKVEGDTYHITGGSLGKEVVQAKRPNFTLVQGQERPSIKDPIPGTERQVEILPLEEPVPTVKPVALPKAKVSTPKPLKVKQPLAPKKPIKTETAKFNDKARTEIKMRFLMKKLTKAESAGDDVLAATTQREIDDLTTGYAKAKLKGKDFEDVKDLPDYEDYNRPRRRLMDDEEGSLRFGKDKEAEARRKKEARVFKSVDMLRKKAAERKTDPISLARKVKTPEGKPYFDEEDIKSLENIFKKDEPKQTYSDTLKDQPVPDKVGNINLSKYPEDVRKAVHDLFKDRASDANTPRITTRQLLDRAKNLDETPLIKHLKSLPEGQLSAELIKMRQGDASVVESMLKLEADDFLQAIKKSAGGIFKESRKVSSEIGRSLAAHKIDIQAQKKLKDLFDEKIKIWKADPILSRDPKKLKQLIKSTERFYGEITDGELLTISVFDHAYYIWINSILSSYKTMAANAIGGAVQLMLKIPDRFLEAVIDQVRSTVSGTPKQFFFREVTAMLKSLGKGEKLPDDLVFAKNKIYEPPFKAKSKIGGAAVRLIGIPTEILKKTDDAVKNIAGVMEKAAQEAKGATGFDKESAILSEQAIRTFQNDLGKIGETLLYARKNIPGFRWVQPFVQAISSIIDQGIERSSLQAGKMASRALRGKYEGALNKEDFNAQSAKRLTTDLRNLVYGSAFTMWVTSMIMKGDMTAGAPTNPNKRDLFYNMEHKKEYAVKINERWVPFTKFIEPIGTSMEIVANMMDDWKDPENKKQDLVTRATSALTTVGQRILTRPYLIGLNNVIQAINDPENKGKPFIRKIVSGFVPGIAKDVAEKIDPTIRQSDNLKEDMMKRTPILSKKLPPKLDRFGREIKRDNFPKVEMSKLEKMLVDTPTRIPSEYFYGEKMERADYDKMLKVTGKPRLRVMQGLANSEKFHKMPIGMRRYLVDHLDGIFIKAYRQGIKEKDFVNDPVRYMPVLEGIIK